MGSYARPRVPRFTSTQVGVFDLVTGVASEGQLGAGTPVAIFWTPGSDHPVPYPVPSEEAPRSDRHSADPAPLRHIYPGLSQEGTHFQRDTQVSMDTHPVPQHYLTEGYSLV